MDNKEIAIKLTIAALQCNKINLWIPTYQELSESDISTEAYYDIANDSNAKKIVDFYNNILNELNRSEE